MAKPRPNWLRYAAVVSTATLAGGYVALQASSGCGDQSQRLMSGSKSRVLAAPALAATRPDAASQPTTGQSRTTLRLLPGSKSDPFSLIGPSTSKPDEPPVFPLPASPIATPSAGPPTMVIQPARPALLPGSKSAVILPPAAADKFAFPATRPFSP